MPTYYFKATNSSGKVELGSFDVANKQVALSRLEQQGLRVFKVKQV